MQNKRGLFHQRSSDPAVKENFQRIAERARLSASDIQEYGTSEGTSDHSQISSNGLTLVNPGAASTYRFNLLHITYTSTADRFNDVAPSHLTQASFLMER